MTFEEFWNTGKHRLEDDPKQAASAAWDAATTAERERCEKKCEELFSDGDPSYKDYENTYIDGWQDACNECKWVIHGCLPKSVVFTPEELSKAAKIGMDFFSNNSRIDNNSPTD